MDGCVLPTPGLLLVRQVLIWPFEPGREAPQESPAEAVKVAEATAFTAKIRTRCYRVRIALYQIPNLPNPASVNHSAKSSGIGGNGSPRQGKSRTSSLNLTLLAGVTLVARGASRFAYQFEGAAPPGCFEPPTGPARSSKQHRNPIVLAQEWQRALDDGECPSRAALARQLGVTRARVTQVLGLLDLAPEVVHAIAALGDPLSRSALSRPSVHSLLKQPVPPPPALDTRCSHFPLH